MKQQIYPDLSRAERKKAMASAAYKVEYTEYQAPLPADELSAENDAYSQRAIELAKMEADFKAFKAKKAAEIKAIKEEMAVALEVIKTGKREMEANLYLFQDLQTNDMNYFDINGMWIRSRKIRPEERQTTISLGVSDVDGENQGISDEELDEQEIEDGNAVDVTDAKPALGDDVQMSSEYGAMAAVSNAEADDVTVGPGNADHNKPEERPDDGKQAEAEQKLAAHRANKKRLSKKEKELAALAGALIPDNDAAIASTDEGSVQADEPGADEDFSLPKE